MGCVHLTCSRYFPSVFLPLEGELAWDLYPQVLSRPKELNASFIPSKTADYFQGRLGYVWGMTNILESPKVPFTLDSPIAPVLQGYNPEVEERKGSLQPGVLVGQAGSHLRVQ